MTSEANIMSSANFGGVQVTVRPVPSTANGGRTAVLLRDTTMHKAPPGRVLHSGQAFLLAMLRCGNDPRHVL